MEQFRVVDTPQGAITYLCIRKKVKNLNLRVGQDGQPILSIPMRCSLQRADRLIQEKILWIQRVQRQMRQRVSLQDLPVYTPEQSRDSLIQALKRVFPLVEPFHVAFPILKVRKMRTQWGNCHYRQNYITLNTALARCPVELQDYVALHELVHFLHPNHGKEFYAVMDQLMPDWKAHRQKLKEYASILNETE